MIKIKRFRKPEEPQTHIRIYRKDKAALAHLMRVHGIKSQAKAFRALLVKTMKRGRKK